MSEARDRTTADEGRELREALDWLAADKAEPELSRETIRFWSDWCGNRKNRASYSQAIELREIVRRSPRPDLPSAKALRRDFMRESGTVSNWRRMADGLKRSMFPADSEYPWYRVRLRVVAAGIVCLAIGVMAFRSLHRTPVSEQSYMTALGEQRELTLSDGTRVTLGGGTAIVVRFGKSERSIELNRGDAYFHVARDLRRPFVVHAGVGSATALGTEFDVRRYGRYTEYVQVWVRQGVVEVETRKDNSSHDTDKESAAAQPMPVLLGQGQEVTYAHDESSKQLKADRRVITAWQEGHLAPLIYRGRSLTDVLEELQSYTKRPIMIDAAVADLQYTGIVIQDDVDAWIRDLPTIYPELAVIDCRANSFRPPGCADPRRILIQWRLKPSQNLPKSAEHPALPEPSRSGV